MSKKNIVTAAAVGFGLSFLIGIFSGGKTFPVILFRALVFAAIFACIAIVVGIVFSKFLDIDIFSAQSSEPQPEEKRPASGSVVDITLSDESLVDDGGASFNIGRNAGPVASDAATVPPAAKKEPAAESAVAENAPEAFKPVRLAGDDVPPAQEKSPDASRDNAEDSPAAGRKSEELPDDLPDIGEIVPELAVPEAAAEATDFYPAGEPVSAPRASSSRNVSAGSENVAELAAAIRTVLAKDGA